MTWEIDANVWIERDEYDFARHLRHTQSPFSVADAPAGADYATAIQYLTQVRGELGLSLEQIFFLLKTIPSTKSATGEGEISTEPGEQLRWWRRRTMRNETTILVLQQTQSVPLRTMWFTPPYSFELRTMAALNVYGAGVRIVMHRQANGRFAVTSAASTLRHNFDFSHASAIAEVADPIGLNVPRTRRGRNAADRGADATNTSVVRATASLAPAAIANQLLEKTLAGLGLEAEKKPSEFGFWIYRFRPNELKVANTAIYKAAGFAKQRSRPELVSDSDYPVAILRHTPSGLTEGKRVGLDAPPLDIVSRLPDFALLDLVPLMAGARAPASAAAGGPRAKVFTVDPVSATGEFDLRPNRPGDELAVVQRSVRLPRLDAAVGSPRRVALRGRNVVVVKHDEVAVGAIGIDPPTQPVGQPFNYPVRTNDFAAVNAYYHLDRMFHRLEKFGLPFQSYAPAFYRKADVIHRAAIHPGPGGDGRCINAQIRVRPGEQPTQSSPTDGLHRLEFRFALADLSLRPGAPRRFVQDANPSIPQIEHPYRYPLGIACDVRWIWHEFGHALIAGATGDLELRFAHSVGDALAAINCDPNSVLAQPQWAARYRGVTFPWVNGPLRRHDRKAADGWSWTRRLGRAQGYREDMGDVAGYRREQVLSSTLFRLYCAAGGDAVTNGMPDIARRQVAADYVTYLIVRALGSLGPAATTPATDASVFASALMDADCGTTLFDYGGLPPDYTSQKRVGGTLHKVIRWSFEKQGLYARGPRRPDGSGLPESVDIYVNDGRLGEYQHNGQWLTPNTELWVRWQPDGMTRHQSPKRGAINYVYVRVRNRGTDTAFNMQATLRAARWRSSLGWPDTAAWTGLPPATANNARADLSPGASSILGPFAWTPTRADDYAVMVELNAPGDRSNINPATGLPCASPQAPSTSLSALVPYDNNLAVAIWRAS